VNKYAEVKLLFQGVEGVMIQYYSGGVWHTHPGLFDNAAGFINIPVTAQRVRALQI